MFLSYPTHGFLKDCWFTSFTMAKFLSLSILKIHQLWVCQVLCFMSLKFLGFTIFKLLELRVSHVLRFASLKFHNLNLPELWVSRFLGYSNLVETASFTQIEVYKAPYSNGTLRLSSELLTLPTKILHVLDRLYDRIPTCMQILVNAQ